MPHVSHRLDLYLVPADEREPASSDLERLWREGVARGHWTDDGGPGPAADALVPRGLRGVRLDRPGRRVLYANQQGGFQVRCPRTDAPIVSAFSRAMAGWREGGDAALECSACGGQHARVELVFRPPAAFGAFALVVVDAGASTPTESGAAWIEAALGPFVVVGRRVS